MDCEIYAENDVEETQSLFVGSEAECYKVIEAFKIYGIPERKFLIKYPEFHDFELPTKTKEKIFIELCDSWAGGKQYNGYAYEQSEYELQECSDYELLEYYEQINCDYDFEQENSDEDDINEQLEEARLSLKSYQADKVLLGDE